MLFRSLFIINHTDDEAVVKASGLELLTATEATGEVMVPAGAVAVVQES